MDYLAGLRPSTSCIWVLQLLLMAWNVGDCDGKRAAWEYEGDFVMFKCCWEGMVLAPGSIWSYYIRSVNITHLRDFTYSATGKKTFLTKISELETLTPDCGYCWDDIFICIKESRFIRFCPTAGGLNLNFGRGENPVCGYILSCDFPGVCARGVCYMRLNSYVIYMYTYSNKRNLLLTNSKYTNSWMAYRSADVHGYDEYADLQTGITGPYTGVLVGFRAFFSNESRPALFNWNPSQCSFQEEYVPDHCRQTRTPTVPAMTVTQGAVTTSFPISSVTDDTLNNTTDDSLDNGRQQATSNSQGGAIAGGVIAGLLILLIVFILIILIRRGILTKSTLSRLKVSRSKNEENNPRETNIQATVVEPYDDVAIYSRKIPKAPAPDILPGGYDTSTVKYENVAPLYDTVAIDEHVRPNPLRVPQIQYATLDLDNRLINNKPIPVIGPQTQYATIEIDKNDKPAIQQRPAIPQKPKVLYANVDVNNRVRNTPVMPKKYDKADYDDEESDTQQVEYAVVDPAKKRKNQPGIFIVENDQYGNCDTLNSD